MFKGKRRLETGASSAFSSAPYQPSAVEKAREETRKRKNRKNRAIAAISSFLVLGTLALIVVLSPGFKTLRDTFFDWAYGVEVLPKVILGFTDRKSVV